MDSIVKRQSENASGANARLESEETRWHVEQSQTLEILELVVERLDQMQTFMEMSRNKDVYTVTEAAKRLSRAPWTVRNWCNKGQVDGAYKLKGVDEWRIPYEALVKVEKEGPRSLKPR